MWNLVQYGGQGPPLLHYLIVALSLMAALAIGKMSTVGYKSPSPEYFNFQVADYHRKDNTPSFVSWRST